MEKELYPHVAYCIFSKKITDIHSNFTLTMASPNSEKAIYGCPEL
jgi:hypothetical protein